jgi:hypothetical protein
MLKEGAKVSIMVKVKRLKGLTTGEGLIPVESDKLKVKRTSNPER